MILVWYKVFPMPVFLCLGESYNHRSFGTFYFGRDLSNDDFSGFYGYLLNNLDFKL